MRSPYLAALLAAALLASSGTALAEETLFGWLISPFRQKEVKPVDNKAYKEECSACHMAYPPGLLPSRSWEKLLNEQALGDHFGDDASLDGDTLREIHDYAMENAADKSFHKRSRKIALATENGEAPLRIIEVRYIKRKHHDIPEKMISGNKDVKSLSFCSKCHTRADDGNFDSDTVSIPNYPDWED
ncbi:MAG: diheme cytochrome c [Nitrosomonadales bacterium]|nr:diheme cytochrome c [Nitrosomonadales bacterium]